AHGVPGAAAAVWLVSVDGGLLAAVAGLRAGPGAAGGAGRGALRAQSAHHPGYLLFYHLRRAAAALFGRRGSHGQAGARRLLPRLGAAYVQLAAVWALRVHVHRHFSLPAWLRLAGVSGGVGAAGL
nr:hypothetical protein [Tanacetum cinerariifolium]